jgi:uncharacterized membrane protein AbrB (regulator of aidB expression)
MPITGTDFAISIAIMIGLAVAVILLNKRRPKAGWWLIATVVAFVIVGNLIERLATGSSPLF